MIVLNRHDSPLVSEGKNRALDMKRYQSTNVIRSDIQKLNLEDNNSDEIEVIPEKSLNPSLKKKPASNKKIEMLLDNSEEDRKVNRNSSHQPAKGPIPEKRNQVRKNIIQEGSKTISLFKMMTLKARKNLTETQQNNVDGKLTLPGPTTNLFHKSLQKFKSHVAGNPDEVKNLRPSTKAKINQIIEIEQSIQFRLSRHIMNRLDIFSRFFFPIVFMSWFNFTLFFLDYDWARFVLLNMLIIAGVSGKQYCHNLSYNFEQKWMLMIKMMML